VRIWIDIENPPQVQYLGPFRSAFAALGADTVVTASDHGATVALLEQAGVEAAAFGARLGRGRVRKVTGTLRRARALRAFLQAEGRPDALLGISRSAALAARRLGIPSFVISDYEHANVTVYRLAGSTVLHPEAIDQASFRARGLRADRLVAFGGLKEDISFGGLDLASIAPYELDAPESVARVLFRPPSETSHYYREESRGTAIAALRRLAERDAVVVFSPREPGQISYLEGIDWAHEPVILERPAPFVALLKSVDAVVCSGGTMLREAAYLGIPAYSILRSEIGGVDRRLQELGRVRVLNDVEDLDRLRLGKRGRLAPLAGNPKLLDELARMIAERARAGLSRGSPRRKIRAPEPVHRT
jgi:uncharacterized protein